jgi:spoIIIJ-associated protein
MAEPPDLSVESTGETLGEAKWAALRELERRHPGIDKASVRFEVLSEGERGLLGVGYSPARVLAVAPTPPPPPPAGEAPARAAVSAPRPDESEPARAARELVERIAGTIGVRCDVSVAEGPDSVTVTCSGPDLGLLIGRRGQTIDAIQYLANAVSFRRFADERKEVVVDAAGYRERRRRTLEELAVRTAERVLQTRAPVELEPMTAVERKVVHLALKERAGVATSSEGTEPNRFVVVKPA